MDARADCSCGMIRLSETLSPRSFSPSNARYIHNDTTRVNTARDYDKIAWFGAGRIGTDNSECSDGGHKKPTGERFHSRAGQHRLRRLTGAGAPAWICNVGSGDAFPLSRYG